LGLHGLGRTYPLGRPFETFQSGWGSEKVDPELAEAYSEVPPLFEGTLNYWFSPHLQVFFQAGLKKDFAAWHTETVASTLPWREEDVDLNQPTRGYFHYSGTHLQATLGRFPIHLSPSPEFGLALSQSVPWHNGLWTQIQGSRLSSGAHIRYHFLVSSMHPWLQGTPDGAASSEDYPIGSEEWRQRNYPHNILDNAHKRRYDERIKTLSVHRLEWQGPVLEAGISELSMIGGKVPDLRDLNPATFKHNDFRDGFVNLALSLDAKIHLPFDFSVFGEWMLDDLRYSDKEGASRPSIFGWMAGLAWNRRVAGWDLQSLAHFIRTDPLLYRHSLPYNTLQSRQVWSSNYQFEGDDVFIDKYVVDFPLGYARGGDAQDWRFSLKADGPRGWGGVLKAAYLTHGEAFGSDKNFEDLLEARTPWGAWTEEWRTEVRVGKAFTHGISLQGGWSQQFLLENPAPLKTHGQGLLLLSWRWESH
jgi:hypothetical protein